MISYYKTDIEEDIPKIIKNKPLYNEWYQIIKEILHNQEFQKRKLFPHHKDLSVWTHSILVSYNSFIAAKYFNADDKICAIAGLLHDFYPWSWIENDIIKELDSGYYMNYRNTKHKFFKQHGFIHGKAASENYIKYFPELENKKITNAIRRHMFPLTIIPPRYKEGFIVSTIDKINSVHELPDIYTMADIVYKKSTKEIIKIGNKIKNNY